MDLKTTLEAAEAVGSKYQKKTDYVRWTAWPEDGTEIGLWKSTACYGNIMSKLGLLEIHCLPWNGPSEGQMPAVFYHHFFRLLKQHGLVPPEVKTLHRNGAHCLIVPRTGWDRHTLYITLCYYRQCDLKPDEAMRTMSLYKRLTRYGTSFLQCLHYSSILTTFGAGHWFMNFGPYGGADKLDLANGQALAWFGRLPKEERLKIAPTTNSRGYDNNYTYTFLAKKAKDMSSGVRIEKLIDILDPQYAHLYEEPTPNEG